MLLKCINKCYRIPANMIIYSSFLQTLFLQDVLSIRFNAQLIGCIFLRSRKPFYAFSRIMLDVVLLFVISSTQFDLYIIQYPIYIHVCSSKNGGSGPQSALLGKHSKLRKKQGPCWNFKRVGSINLFPQKFRCYSNKATEKTKPVHALQL